MKVYHNKSNLNRHSRVHTGEKHFACQVCDRKFAQKINLVRHQSTHSDVRSFQCLTCPDSRFVKTKNQLGKHMVYHYEPKYSCSYFDHKSFTSGDLKKHKNTHYKNKTFCKNF